MKLILLFISLMLNFKLGFTQCDLQHFRWECSLTLYAKPTKNAHSLVYCGQTHGYVTKRDYDILTRYHLRNVNMVAAMNDEYIDSPCIPAGR
ncbi:MAG: hypothetical protein CMF38_02605 [Legionellaceae bacterium]|nr:hypothetical protein [Legionellaceae bacterium]HAF87035.1 hypothetical protein [Legionellales bacterium]HCA89996.1 hypothetical protein [Legionellales bacterium]